MMLLGTLAADASAPWGETTAQHKEEADRLAPFASGVVPQPR